MKLDRLCSSSYRQYSSYVILEVRVRVRVRVMVRVSLESEVLFFDIIVLHTWLNFFVFWKSCSSFFTCSPSKISVRVFFSSKRYLCSSCMKHRFRSFFLKFTDLQYCIFFWRYRTLRVTFFLKFETQHLISFVTEIQTLALSALYS